MSVFGLQLANLRRRRLLLLIFVHGKVGISVCIASMQTGSQTHILVWFLSYYEVDYLCAHLFFKGTAKWGDIRKTCVWPTNVFYGKLLQSQTNHHYPSLPLFFFRFSLPIKGSNPFCYVCSWNVCGIKSSISGKQSWRWEVMRTVPTARQPTPYSCLHGLCNVPFALV